EQTVDDIVANDHSIACDHDQDWSPRSLPTRRRNVFRWSMNMILRRFGRDQRSSEALAPTAIVAFRSLGGKAGGRSPGLQLVTGITRSGAGATPCAQAWRSSNRCTLSRRSA